MLLIDSSAIVKFFSKEPGWEKVTGYMSESVTIPLAIVELGSALLKKVLKKDVKMDIALRLIDDYSENAILLDQKKYLGPAFRIAIAKNITIYDSLFIAAAIEEGHTLVSCDDEQTKIAKSLGVKVVEC